MALKDELLALEKTYWDGVKQKDAAVAAKLTADSVVYVGSTGVAQMPRNEIASMAEASDAAIIDYTFDTGSIKVAPIGEAAAVIAYRVSRTSERNGKKEKLVTFDSTVWQRKGTSWQAVMHTETPAPAGG